MNANDPNTKSDPISAPPRFGEWLPIETAPKDSTEILCLDVETGEIRVAVRRMFYEKSRAYEWFRSDEHCLGHTWSLIPTHWMPIPEPPR